MAEKWNKSLSLIDMKVESGLFLAEVSAELEYMRALLEQEGYRTSFFVQFGLGRLTDCADDIMALGRPILLFHVREETVPLVLEVTSAIKTIDPHKKVIWYGAPITTHFLETVMECLADVLLYGNAEQALLLWLQDEQAIPGALTRCQGEWRNHASAIPERSESLDLFPTALNRRRKGSTDVISMKFDDRRWTSEGKCYVRMYSFKRLIGDITTLLSQESQPFHLSIMGTAWLQNKDEAEKILQMIASAKQITGFHLEIEKNEERLLQSFSSDLFTKRAFPMEHTTPLVNGWVACLTGRYPENMLDGGVKHVTLTILDQGESAYWPLQEYTSLNSAFFLEGDQWEHSWTNLDRYTRSHIHGIRQQQGEGNYQISLSMKSIASPISYSLDAYSKRYGSRPLGDYRFRTIESLEDLEMLGNEVDLLEKTGRVSLDANSGFLVDGCRFRSRGACQAGEFPRLYIGSDEQLSLCRNTSAIGRIGDEYDVLKQRVKRLRAIETERRECLTCPIRQCCSSCMLLPEAWSFEEYCSFRRKHPSLERYVELMDLLLALRKENPMFQQSARPEILVVSTTHTYQIPRGITRSFESPMDSNAIFLWWNRTPVLHHLLTGRGLSLSPFMGVLVEGWYAGIPLAGMMDLVQEKIQLDESLLTHTARELTRRCLTEKLIGYDPWGVLV